MSKPFLLAKSNWTKNGKVVGLYSWERIYAMMDKLKL